MKTRPLVTVICLCYNHERFVAEAIDSVVNQTYPNIQIIVVDDASTDDSREIIGQLQVAHPSVETVMLQQNLGNCRAFNKGLAHARGEFIIDFSTDDVMMPERVARQVDHFLTLDDSYGVTFTDAEYIDVTGRVFRHHFAYLLRKKIITHIPEGDVYRDVLTRYFVPSPTMMIRTSIMRKLGGYDEQLSYEDFDFFVRSSRICNYAFLNEKLTRIRRVPGSMSAGLYGAGDRQLHSTYLVCEKALALSNSPGDISALEMRTRYELRQSVFSSNHQEALLFYGLLERIDGVTWKDRALIALNSLRLPLSPMRNLYNRLRFGN